MRIKQTTMNKMLMVFKILLVAIPFLLLMTMNQAAILNGQSLAELMQTDGLANVQLLAAFILPFVAFIIHQQELSVDGLEEQSKTVINLLLIGLAVMIVGYTSLGVLLLVITGLMVLANDISIKRVFGYAFNRKLAVSEIAGSLTILVISLFVGFLLFRVG